MLFGIPLKISKYLTDWWRFLLSIKTSGALQLSPYLPLTLKTHPYTFLKMYSSKSWKWASCLTTAQMVYYKRYIYLSQLNDL